MKRYLKVIVLITIPFLFFSSCVENNNKGTKAKAEEKISMENFDWLLGEWERKNEKQGNETFENWDKISAYQYSGIGFTMQNGDTIKQEKISLIKQKGKWNLIVKAPEETRSITFKMTKYTNDSFTCENDSLDFPKLIKYWMNNGKLKALVSGNDFEIPFEFEKIK